MTFHNRTCLVALSLALLPCFIRAAAPDADKFSRVNEAMKSMVAAREISGAVTFVGTRDKVVHLAAVGEADLAGPAAMKADSIFWIASMSKPITGACVMMMQDEGKLDFNDPVSKYVPEFADIKTPSGKPANLTLKHLLTHTSGLAELTPDEQRSCKTLADVIPKFVRKPLTMEPGSKWQYCQTGINTLARVVEITSGQLFPEFLAKRLTGPLGMKDTTFYPSKEQQARLAKSYKRNKDGTLEEAGIFVFTGQDISATDRVPLANGGLFSTAADYGRFLQMVLNGGTLDGHVYLKPETVKLMTGVQTGEIKTGFTPGNGWGLGWIVTREPQGVTAMLSPGTAGHGGAYGTQGWVDFERGIVLVMMVQRANFPNGDASDVRRAFQQAAVDSLK